MGCLKAEIYKVFFNVYFYFCFVCVFLTSIIGAALIDSENRITREVELFSYLFLFICNLVVGSIIANEYAGTMKDRIIAVGDRRRIFAAKVILCLLGITCIYGFHVILFVLTNKGMGICLFVNQYKAVMQHTFLLIGIAVIARSFSSLSIVTVVMLCIYKELSNLRIPVDSYFVRFMSMDKMNFVDSVFCLTILLSVMTGYILFYNQDIK